MDWTRPNFRLSPTVCWYLARQYLASFAVIFLLFLLVILLADTIELLRRVAGRPEIPFSEVVLLALLKLPYMGQRTFPYAAMFAGMMMFWRLFRHHELTVLKASGLSFWSVLVPVLAVAFALGVLQITLLNPLAATCLGRYERLEAVRVERKATSLALSATGIWLRQADHAGQSVIHAKTVLQAGERVELKRVSVFRFAAGGERFESRLEAASARLEDGAWDLEDVLVLVPEQPVERKDHVSVPTDLTLQRIQESFAPPATLSFWALPHFIRTLEDAGFSATGHRLQYHALLAAPVLMLAMVLFAATFSPRNARSGGAIYVIGSGVFAGFALHVLTDLVFAIGLSDRVPVALAAWTPAVAATLLGAGMLLHFEDG